MPFQKGISGNPGGKPVGSSNQQRVILERMRKIALDNTKQLEKDLKLCDPRDRIRFIIQILSMVLPKPLNEKEIAEVEEKENSNFYMEIHNRMMNEIRPKEVGKS
jgi:hypothetical protein